MLALSFERRLSGRLGNEGRQKLLVGLRLKEHTFDGRDNVSDNDTVERGQAFFD